MSDEIENNLMVQITPMFPQFEEGTVRNVIEIVRQGQINQGQPITVATLLPTCIDYLLDMPPETLNDIRSYANNDWRNEIDRRRFAGIEVLEELDGPKFPAVAAAVNNKGSNKNGGKAKKVNGAKNNAMANADESFLIPNDFFGESFDLYDSGDDNDNFSYSYDELSRNSSPPGTDEDSYDSNEAYDYAHMRFDHNRRSPLRSDTSNSSSISSSTDSDKSTESTQLRINKEIPVRLDASSTSTNSFKKPHVGVNIFERVTPKNLPSKSATKNAMHTVPLRRKTSKTKLNGSFSPIQNGKAKIEVIEIDHLSPVKVPAPKMQPDIQTHTNNMPSTSSTENIAPKKQTPPKQDPIQAAVTQVLLVVPDLCEKYATDFLTKEYAINCNDMANRFVEHLFEQESYPKKIVKEAPKPVPETKKEEKKKTEKDYLQVKAKKRYNKEYADQCLSLLANAFNKVSMQDIRYALSQNYGRYARTFKYLNERIKENREGNGKKLTFMKGLRSKRYVSSELHRTLKKEAHFLIDFEKKQSEAQDHTLALSLNEQQYEEEGQLIECGCCYGEAVFEEMIQCIEGHLFCSECLKRYANESIFGQGKMQMFCMTDGCDSSFPLSQLKKVLPENLLDKYQERLQDESLKMVELPNLVRCPFCDYAAEMPEGDKVFQCQNEKCLKESCRYCKEPWIEHFGIPCNEVEKKAQTNLRLSYEEKMSMAKIRTCSKCGCGFMKTDGCNKMTCRCGTKMCYICRKPRIDYNHFCGHPRDPGQLCEYICTMTYFMTH
eukprot:Seg788.8 transcript_id=Seg788.8/GoldUCD/mRNA.D3Y31 product="E3 ubiquitin-protein ligase RNF216" protein_id=Seg788.8/GoldUCD/D3Y31